MARKKTSRKKKTVSRKKTALKKSAARKAASARKKTTKKAAPKKLAAKGKSAGKKKSSAKKKSATRKATRRRVDVVNPVTPSGLRGLGAASGGQSGDTQGLSRRSYDDSESVEELLEEGQYAEAEAVSGVENAPDADESEVHTREVPEDDVPEEYTDRDE
jgi:hypothetical protein